jgi:predicted small lipoprotein YifL
MKRTLKSIFALMLLVSITLSCEKKTNDPPVVIPPEKNNEMVYNGTSYALSQGFFENFGQVPENGSYNIDLVLISSGIVLHESNGIIDSVAGSGEFFYFELFSSDSVGLTEGTYTYDPNYPGENGTFTTASGAIDFDIENETGFEFEIEEGTFTVIRNEGIYEFSFNGTDDFNHLVTLYFKGEIPFIEI